MTSFTASGIAYDREGPRGELPIVLIYAGVADRGMWDPIWPELTAEYDVVRMDLRGFGESATRPAGVLSHPGDVLDTLTEIGIARCRLVGLSLGAGVAVEVALTERSAVASLLLAPPVGSLLTEMRPDLRAFIDAESGALERGDVDAAVEANLSWWVEGTRRRGDQVDPFVRDHVRRMQRRAFAVTADWEDVAEQELDPPALDRLSEIGVPVLVLVGGLDLDTVHDAAARVVAGIAGARRADWPNAGHLPSLENPAAFAELLREWVKDASAAAPS